MTGLHSFWIMVASLYGIRQLVEHFDTFIDRLSMRRKTIHGIPGSRLFCHCKHGNERCLLIMGTSFVSRFG